MRARDVLWSVLHDRLDCADKVRALAGDRATPSAIDACFAIQSALSSLDRLEVRGRDSAGIHVFVTRHGIDATEVPTRKELARRNQHGAFRSEAVRLLPDGTLSFVYKCAAEIGELGDNVAALRAAIAGDSLLHAAIRADDAEATVLAHTRWASIGIISENNAHPLNSEEPNRTSPYSIAVLNGDVDNYRDLVSRHDLTIEPEITTDAKVIPTLLSRRIASGDSLIEAFRSTVESFEGSVAIAASAADHPGHQLFALRGSGQAIYIGLAEDTFIVASEPYGVTELTNRYLRLDGETPGNPANPTGSRGQIVSLDRSHAGELAGIERVAYDGTTLPIDPEEITTAEVTTRDVDRGAFRHYLLKEITESPSSFRKTLRGRIEDAGGRLRVRVGPGTLSEDVRKKLASGSIKRIVVIGQGTAAIAGQGVLSAIDTAIAGRSDITTQATPATELSGFQMRPDMSDTLVVAISQSGTTTDTNRTVDLVRARGAIVVAIVNRRGSDLTDKADGVLYTSDGRDVEMSVASTKAFYAQIAAGVLLSFALAREFGCVDEALENETLHALLAMPSAMRRVIENRAPVRDAAVEFATKRRYWAVVGNGNNKIAAAEIRIKLSELCYKSIACDATEDKKHIDLSAEPMILVCAAGLRGSTADDVAKEVAIYAAHQSAPIVIASEGEDRFTAAAAVVTVPVVHASLDFVLSAVVGHLFGYEAALAIDALARPLRAARSAIERAARNADDASRLLDELAPELLAANEELTPSLRAGLLDGQLEASTAAQLMSLMRYGTGVADLDSFQIEHGKPGTPSAVVEDLTAALTEAIEQLTRPIDAIKHQAKTVTVGISRSDEALQNEPLVRAVLEAGAGRDSLAYHDLRALATLSPLVSGIAGFSRYRVEASGAGDGTIRQVSAGGIARQFASRTDDNPQLKGTKHQVSRERRLLVALGRSDNRPVVIVPETNGTATTGITLLHVDFVESADAAILRTALTTYRDRWTKLEEAVTETEPVMRPEILEDVPVIECLTSSIEALAVHWRSAPAGGGGES